MFVTLHCGGMPFDGNTIKERSLGGSESAAYYVARGLAKAGHRVSIFTNCTESMESEGVRYVPAGVVNEDYPLGKDFHRYATNTPIDVLIIQRHPQAFFPKYASKVNIWWLHDLALKRHQMAVASHVQNVDYVAVVSEYHKKQVQEIYAIPEDRIKVVRNGVDLDIFNECLDTCENEPLKEFIGEVEKAGKKLVTYSSRPERGFEHLVKPDGILEKLGEDYVLAYCNYLNPVSHMQEFYDMLENMSRRLPNSVNVGHLSKLDLAFLMRSAHLHLYPTEFEEVSCITAMECAAAGLPLVSSKFAALPETCEGTGSTLIEISKPYPVEKFCSVVKTISKSDKKRSDLVAKQIQSSSGFSWDNVAARFEEMFNSEHSDLAKVNHAIYTSDIVMLDRALEKELIKDEFSADLARRQLDTYYSLLMSGDYKKHYDNYYDNYEKARGVEYGPEDLNGQPRFEHTRYIVSEAIQASEKEKCTVLDYGCAHGHYTVNLAKSFPDHNFVGVDVSHSNIETAKQWAEDEGVSNVEFYLSDFTDRKQLDKFVQDTGYQNKFDVIMACEVLEHVINPEEVVDGLTEKLSHDETLHLLSTPYGPWEAIGYEENTLRAHVIHFEKKDLHGCFGHFDNFSVTCIPGGHDRHGNAIGSYIATYHPRGGSVNFIDYHEKWNSTVPYRQTLSACIIAYNCEDTISRTIKSIAPVVDEFVIALDERTNDDTEALIDKFKEVYPWKRWVVEKRPSPLEIGFDDARNWTLEQATCDWLFWPDTDEMLTNMPSMSQILKPSLVDGFATPLSHISFDPPEVLKIDYPVKLFRNGMGASFYGRVHEHPEVEMNKGIPFVKMSPSFGLAHPAYTDESVRRRRFERNLPLLMRDREDHPDRYLGKFLFIRDLAQMNGYERERSGVAVSKTMLERCALGIKLFEELLEDKQYRMLVDGFQFYNQLTDLVGYDFEMSFCLDVHKVSTRINEVAPITGRFHSREFALKFIGAIIDERTSGYESDYF